MKKTIFIAFVLGVSILLSAQSQTNDMANLQKQITFLKLKNFKLEKNLLILKTELTTQSDKTKVSLKELENKLNATEDRLQKEESILIRTQQTSRILFLSLQHRKKLFIIGAIIGIIAIGGIAIFINKKYKADFAKQETLTLEKNRIALDELNKTRSELLSQIGSIKDILDKKLNDLMKTVDNYQKQNKVS